MTKEADGRGFVRFFLYVATCSLFLFVSYIAMASRTTTFVDNDAQMFTVRAPAHVPESAIESNHHDFIADHWVDLAAASYMGFQRLGIGLVVVQERPSVDEAVQIEAHTIGYAQADGAWLTNRSDTLPVEWIDTQLQSYDPNDAVLALFVEDEATIRAYAVSAQPSPPDALHQARAQLN